MLDAIFIIGIILMYLVPCAIIAGLIVFVLFHIPYTRDKLEEFFRNLPMNRR